MPKPIALRTTRSTKGSGSPIPKPPKGLSLADVVSVTHTVGHHVTKVRGAESPGSSSRPGTSTIPTTARTSSTP
jgi:hypothetical protein